MFSVDLAETTSFNQEAKEFVLEQKVFFTATLQPNSPQLETSKANTDAQSLLSLKDIMWMHTQSNKESVESY